jgi:mono/diheme cytochrome c family protein
MIHGFWRRLLTAVAVAFFASPAIPAAEPVRPIVPGFERFYTGARADAVGGQLLLSELNCVSCHQPGDKSLTRKQAPILDHIGNRMRVGHLRKFLSDPQAVKPGTTMPNLFAGDSDKQQKVEALVQFLASTGAIRHERVDSKSVASGKDLYSKVGCVACHGPRDNAGNAVKASATVVPLGELKGKYSIGSLAAFLENPHTVRPSGRMPKLLVAKEAKDVAGYLLQGININVAASQGTTSFAYYEGGFDNVPDFAKLKSNGTGIGAAFDLGAAKRESNYALQFEGYFKLDRDAEYTFTLHSDDGSRLYVDGKLVVDNDGVHPPQAKQGKSRLTRGIHKVSVGFFQAGGGAELSVQIEAPGAGAHNLGELTAATEAALDKKPVSAEPKDEDAIEIQPALVEKGKSLFASAGCASCHQMNVDGKAVVSALSVPTLAKLRPEQGCLAATPAKGTPWFALGAAQKTALAAAIKTPPAPPKTPAEVIARTMTTFNCYACHVRGEVGGAVDELNKLFLTTQPEMGEEGRVPPPLTGVGAKLNPDYMKQILDKGAHDRPYMHTRMPGFGVGNVGQLVEAFGAVDTLPKVPEIQFADSMQRVKSSARQLIGPQAFACTKCHTFNGQKAEGVQGIDMVLMTKRLKRDWFHAYIENPQAVRPGTRMPTGFLNGKSILPEYLDGKPATQIEAMWVYLLDGGKAQPPAGLGKQYIPLVPKTSAILYRNFIQGVGPRAIGVGYPEKANLAFDANDMRLAMIWQGGFIDAGKHWTDRGDGFQVPLGDNVLSLHGGVPFAVLAKPDDAWPVGSGKSHGYRFLGYHLSEDDRPTFLYTVGDVKIEDFPNGVAGKDPSIRRTLTLTGKGEKLHFRAAVGSKIETLSDGWYRIDGTWKLKIDSAVAPQVRSSGGKSELLVPVPLKDGKARIVLDYVW